MYITWRSGRSELPRHRSPGFLMLASVCLLSRWSINIKIGCDSAHQKPSTHFSGTTLEFARPWSTLRRGSSKLSGGSSPSKQKKVAAAKRATVGQEDPAESPLDGVADAYTSKIDRSAMRTVSREHSVASFLYVQLSQPGWRQGPRQSRMTAWSRITLASPRPRSGRLLPGSPGAYGASLIVCPFDAT